jgi:hypothetical protein
MNPFSTETIYTTTFVVHFWREWMGTESRWRGRVEHVGSGRQANFLEIADLLGFFQRFGISGADPLTGRSGEPVEPAA